MIPRRLAPLAFAVLAALLAAPDATAVFPGAPPVTLLEPSGPVVLDKTHTSILFRFKVDMQKAKALLPGMSFWAAPSFQIQGKTFDIAPEYRTPAVPESGIVEVRIFDYQVLLAGKSAGFGFDGPRRLDWLVDIRPKNQGVTVMTGHGSLTPDIKGHSAIGVGPDAWGPEGWPTTFTVANSSFWSSKPTTLKVTVQRLDENVEAVRQHCPVRIADFEAPVPGILYTSFAVPAKKPTPHLSLGTAAKLSAAAPLVKNMKPPGIRSEIPVNVTVPLN
jgi:hypothetical protein